MRSLLKIVFSITLLELFLGGGGRVFEVGSITLRILLFSLNIFIAATLYIYRETIPIKVLSLLIISFSAILFYSILGWFNEATFPFVLEDIKPLSYFFSILFFSYYIDSINRVHLVVSIIKKTSLFMAVCYISIQSLFYFGKLDFIPFYHYINTKVSASDFFFRGTEGLFFYKGFLYMVVGLIFWIHADNSRRKAISILIIMTAMILTGTRGFILMFGFVYALFYGIPLLMKLRLKAIILAIILISGSTYFFRNMDIGNKAISDSVRVQQVIQVIERINPVSFFIGHGFGKGVPIRDVHMEIGYLEVFHKQGMLGIALWAAFFLLLYTEYANAKNYLAIRKSFFLGISFVALLSFTNPFFNNPIGISLFMIALSVFWALNRLSDKEDINDFNIKQRK